MTFKTLAMASTALSLTVGAAWAQDNETYLTQNGDNNTALVEQSGSDNEAGASERSMTQLGYNNQLTIDQSGNFNEVGLEGEGIYQENQAESNVNFVIDVAQTSSFNEIGSIKQIATGDASRGTRNSATITQSGGGFNRVGSVYQQRKSSGKNVLEVTQSGLKDRLETVYQSNNAGGTSPNTINVTMDGIANGREQTLEGFAGATGAQGSALKQGQTNDKSHGNAITLDVSGTLNDFGVSQDGSNNTVGALTLTGAQNELGIVQNGTGNEVALADVGGFYNNIGISQSQSDNYANVSVTGNYNRTGLAQDGNSNIATVTITGDNNGRPYDGTFFGIPYGSESFQGDALQVSLTEGVELGKISQLGNGNDVDLKVTGDNNGFGLVQEGDGNVINGTQNGSWNQVAVAQMSNGNLATFTQVGYGNNLGISQ